MQETRIKNVSPTVYCDAGIKQMSLPAVAQIQSAEVGYVTKSLYEKTVTLEDSLLRRKCRDQTHKTLQTMR
jgi:hypothetical protein